MSSDWDNNDEEEGKDQNKAEDWDKYSEKTSQTNPRFFVATPQPPKPSIKQLSKRSSVTPEKEEHRCNMLATLLEHENQDTLETID